MISNLLREKLEYYSSWIGGEEVKNYRKPVRIIKIFVASLWLSFS